MLPIGFKLGFITLRINLHVYLDFSTTGLSFLYRYTYTYVYKKDVNNISNFNLIYFYKRYYISIIRYNYLDPFLFSIFTISIHNVSLLCVNRSTNIHFWHLSIRFHSTYFLIKFFYIIIAEGLFLSDLIFYEVYFFSHS